MHILQETGQPQGEGEGDGEGKKERKKMKSRNKKKEGRQLLRLQVDEIKYKCEKNMCLFFFLLQ